MYHAFCFAGIGHYGERLMNCFKWGHAFYSVNDELLQKYEKCTTSTEVVAVQNKYLENLDSKDSKDSRGMLFLLLIVQK